MGTDPAGLGRWGCWNHHLLTTPTTVVSNAWSLGRWVTRPHCHAPPISDLLSEMGVYLAGRLRSLAGLGRAGTLGDEDLFPLTAFSPILLSQWSAPRLWRGWPAVGIGIGVIGCPGTGFKHVVT